MLICLALCSTSSSTDGSCTPTTHVRKQTVTTHAATVTRLDKIIVTRWATDDATHRATDDAALDETEEDVCVAAELALLDELLDERHHTVHLVVQQVVLLLTRWLREVYTNKTALQEYTTTVRIRTKCVIRVH